MKKKVYLFVLLALCVCGMRAQYVAPTEGVFRIVNVGYNAALMENYKTNTLHCTATIGDNNDFDQLWILKELGSGYSIQNAYTGAYIQTGNTGTEVPYWTGATARAFNITVGGSKKGYNIFDPTLGKQGLHSKGANGNVVRWVDCEPSEWKFEKVEVSEEAMTLAQAEYAEYYRLKMEFENTCAELLANQDKFEKALAKYFEDAACTVLKAEFASASEEELRKALIADNLPTELIDMAIKVKTGKWAEPNEKSEKPGWDDAYAKKFRVQLIEPHSIAGEITEWIGHQGHTNMDNPTGLYANYRQVLYVMVEGEIKEGSELWATWLIGHDKMPNYNNGYGDRGMRLKSGLNIVPIRNDGSALYFNYLVHTYDKKSRKFAHKLSNYDDLKIHVAGGYINGYYNVVGDELYKGDNDDDWVYYEERANLRNITILGRYEVLQFELNDVNHVEDDGSTWSHRGLAKLFPEELPAQMPNSPAFTAPNQRINAIVEAWDRIFLSEKMTLGVASKADVDSMNKLFPRWDATWTEKAEIYNYDDALYAFCDSLNDRDGDYGEYYNHRGVAFGTRSGYMYGSWDHSGYHINTTPSILTAIATEAGPTWGPGHEIGHQHQALFTLNGQMEVTNNLFANISVWYMGMGTSRINGTEGRLEDAYYVYRTGGDLFGYETKHIWVMTQMYYRLWLYYHRVGNNTQFYPRLFELLRKNPMERSYGSGSILFPGDAKETGFQYTSGRKSYVHFYQLCCEAAQEDLTEFFRAYGYFVPVKDRFVGDYTNSMYSLTQKEIDKAIAEVKAKGYPVNNLPLFINDCTPDPTYSHDGKTQRSYWDGNATANGTNAEIGNYIDFMSKDPLTGKYLYTITDLKVKIEGGDGALGFAIYTKEGEILAFSNHHSFVINEEVENMVRRGEATIVAVTAEGDDVKVLSKAEGGSEEEQLQVLKTSLAAANSVLKLVDDLGVNVGYYKPGALAPLQALVDAAEAARDNKDTSVHSYGEWAMLLDQTVLELSENADAKVPLYEEDYYALGSVRHKNNSLEYSTAGLKVTFADPAANTKKQWLFVPSGVEDQYYMQNVSSGLYVSAVSDGVRVKAAATDTKSAVAFTFVEDEPSRFLLRSVGSNALYLSCDNSKNVVAATSTASAQWTLTSVADNHSEAMKAKLEAFISMVAVTFDELVEATEPALKFHDDITILDDNLPVYVANLQIAYEAARKAVAESYTYLEDYYAALDAAHRTVKAAYKKALSLPEATAGDEAMCYYLQCLDTEAYAYHFEGAGRYNGALRTSGLTDASNHNYWFYLRPGEAEGQYYIYNLYTGKAVGTSGRYIYANGTVEPTVYTLAVSEEAYGYTIGTEEGVWNVQSSDNGYVQFTSKAAQWMLVPIGRFDVTGIDLVEHDTATGVYYDLIGRPVEHPTSGIYILDGRKVIIK